MIPQFPATAESLSKASSFALRVGVDAHLYDRPNDVSIAQVHDSEFDPHRVEALTRLIVLISQGAYVRHPEEVFLSTNCFEKDLSNSNPLVRAHALRIMAGIQLHTAAPIVSTAVSKHARVLLMLENVLQMSSLCGTIYKFQQYENVQDKNDSIIKELVSLLLGDSSRVVVVAAAYASTQSAIIDWRQIP